MDIKSTYALIAACSALSGALLSGVLQAYLIEKKSKIDRELSNYENRRKLAEKIHFNLSSLSLKLSLAKVDMAEGEDKIRYFDKNYGEAHDLISEVLMISSLYFPGVKEKLLTIEDQANLYWGYFKATLKIDIAENQEGWQFNCDKATSASIDCLELIKKAKAQLELEVKNTK
ncbi:hypothetical protein ACJJIW_18665 [Microbulbifer sp. JMSA004]|uniref:hypothetical protein n=1 Tax=unclassified Microbulbifer TaxID=2619833 RepID=UPI004039429D